MHEMEVVVGFWCLEGEKLPYLCFYADNSIRSTGLHKQQLSPSEGVKSTLET